MPSKCSDWSVEPGSLVGSLGAQETNRGLQSQGLQTDLIADVVLWRAERGEDHAQLRGSLKGKASVAPMGLREPV